MNNFEIPRNLIPPAYTHQKSSTAFQVQNSSVFDMSDPGTGKTRSYLDGFSQRRESGVSRRALVLAPKSILEPAWHEDIVRFTPHLTASVAYATNRKKAFQADADIYITNHDAVKWLLDNPWAFDNCTDLVVDESTAYKNPQAKRTKALIKLAGHFNHKVIMSGTPAPNTVCDLWSQTYVLDGGDRLGKSFWKFRNSVCEPVQVGPSAQMLKWQDREGAVEAAASLLDDITIRNVFEDCIDIPPNLKTNIAFTLPAKLRKPYEEMAEHSLIALQNQDITSSNAAVLMGKLLQLASGAVYDNDSAKQVFATDRYELIIDLIEQRESCVVAYNWGHQLDELCKLATARKLSYACINGATSNSERKRAVEDFQKGEIKVIFAHPKSAAHGLTLTRGTTTIWASPTWSSEQYEQFNRRIYRAGQTRKTETIHIMAQDTVEEHVYNKLQGKLDQQATLLDLLGM
jgi:SNF2 family DNA or RNA helicase